jgi:hypothetical protein
MNRVTLNRHAPLLGFVLLTSVVLLAVEHSRLPEVVRLPIEIFLVIVLATASLRNYQPPTFLERNLGRPTAIGIAVVLGVAVVLLVVTLAAHFFG